MPASLLHTFVDGVGNVASGEDVMDNFNAVNAGVHIATVTSLPGSPVNGQDVYYLADATNGIVWHLKYRAASASAYKWEVVGGPPLTADVATEETTVSTTFAALATAGPSVTVPLAGDYDVEVGARTAMNAQSSSLFSYAIGGTVAADSDAAIGAGNSTQFSFQAARRRRKTGLAASTALVARYRVTAAATGYWSDRTMVVMPVRVG